MSEKTLGEARVRTDFNVSGSTHVDSIKKKSAELINLIDLIKSERTDAGKKIASGEFMRLCSLAQTDYENAAMWAVKAATF